MGLTIHKAPKKIHVQSRGESVNLPMGVREQIDQYFQELQDAGRVFENKSVYHIHDMQISSTLLACDLLETDYAHYIWSQDKCQHVGRYAVNVLHIAAFLETSNGDIVLGRMAQHTARPGGIQAIGGGLEEDVLDENGIFNLSSLTLKEIHEEVGLNLQLTTMYKAGKLNPTYIVKGGGEGKVAVIYHLPIDHSSGKFLENYKNANGSDELRAVELVDKRSHNELEQFIEQNRHSFSHYVEIALREIARGAF